MLVAELCTNSTRVRRQRNPNPWRGFKAIQNEHADFFDSVQV